MEANETSANGTMSGQEDEYNWPFIIVFAFVVAGTVGNILVCLAVSLERPLQNVTNWFLVSLAFADLLVSTVVMPFGATAGFLGYWPLSSTWCNIYVTCDVLACSASILHMCCISLGRYLGIKSPLRARHSGRYASKRLVILRVVLVWLLALLISSPISTLGLIDLDNIMIGDQCVINNRGFAFFGSLAAFYVPMIIMVVSYALTVQLLRKKARLQQQQTVRRSTKRGQTPSSAFQTSLLTCVDDDQVVTNSRGTQTPVNVSRERRKLMWKATFFSDQQIRVVRASESHRNRRLRNGTGEVPSTPNISSAAAVANEQKASKVLGVVFFTFVLCWAPFFILNVLMAVCESCQHYIPDRLVALCLWLGYVSSTINPIIYTVFNRTFKRVFIQLLLCRCKRQAVQVKRNYSRCNSLYDGLTMAASPAAVGIGLAALSSKFTRLHTSQSRSPSNNQIVQRSDSERRSFIPVADVGRSSSNVQRQQFSHGSSASSKSSANP